MQIVDVWAPQPEVLCIGQSSENDTEMMATFPWAAPGATPVFSPCGTMGGHLGPCGDGGDEQQFGDCCGSSCGGSAYGDNAENYEWPEIPVTEWIRGSFQEQQS